MIHTVQLSLSQLRVPVTRTRSRSLNMLIQTMVVGAAGIELLFHFIKSRVFPVLPSASYIKRRVSWIADRGLHLMTRFGNSRDFSRLPAPDGSRRFENYSSE